MRPALFIQRSDANQLSNLVASEAKSLSFPVLSTSSEDKFPKLPDAYQPCSQSELMPNPTSRQASALSSSGGTCGHLFSSPSIFPNGSNVSSVFPYERRPQNFSLISQSNDGKALQSIHASHSEMLSTPLINHTEENKDVTWCPDSIQDFLDFPEMASVQNGPIESSTGGVMTYGDHAEKTDWPDWDQFPTDEVLDQYLAGFPDDVNTEDSKPKVCSST